MAHLKRFEHRPRVVEAIQNDGSLDAYEALVARCSKRFGSSIFQANYGRTTCLRTLAGSYDIPLNWWVVFPEAEDPYVMDPDIFNEEFREAK